MKCFVHVGFDPEPKEADNPVEAIALAVKYLNASNEDFPEAERLTIKWRRDDLYPDNYQEYTPEDITILLKDKGEAVLQLVEIGADGLPIVGEIANIFTVDQEEKNNEEANQALEAERSLSQLGISTYGPINRSPASKPPKPSKSMKRQTNPVKKGKK